MSFVENAEQYASHYGWGARGKFIGVSRMLHDNDITQLVNSKFVCAYRPRGIISGFLVIVPNSGLCVYLPPVAAKMGPQVIRCRLSEKILQMGTIFSAYSVKDNENKRTMIIEDVLQWGDKSVWFTHTFSQRWELLREFFEKHYLQDLMLQSQKFVLQTYVPIHELNEPSDRQVLEFCMEQKGTKRFIWNPPKVEHIRVEDIVAKRESTFGPDVYSVYRNNEKLGQALVRTLTVSKALRNAGDIIPVSVLFNKQFEKWEIVDVKIVS